MQSHQTIHSHVQRSTGAFVGASWAALFAGAFAYVVGLWNAQMLLSEKGYYFTILAFGLFSAVSLQKSVRDRLQSIPVTGISTRRGGRWIHTATTTSSGEIAT